MAPKTSTLPPADDLPRRVDGAVNPKPIFCYNIKTAVLDSQLETVLDRYVENGTAEEYGAVLFVDIPRSRPRTMPPSRNHTVQEWPLTCRMPKTKIDGCYILNHVHLGSRSQDWMGQLETQSNSAPAKTIDSQIFVDALVNERPMGYQCESIFGMAAGAGYKQQLKVKQWPTAYGRSIISRANTVNSNELLDGTYLNISSSGTAIPMEKSVADLLKIYYHHRGIPVNWIVVPPSESQKLENCIKVLFEQDIKEPSCSQFVKHLNLWIRPELLQEWGVGYIQVKQEALHMLAFFLSSYYWCMSSGFSIIESKLSGSKSWNVESWRFCNASSSLCKAGGANEFFQISQQEVDAILEADASGVKRKRGNRRKADMPRVEEFVWIPHHMDPEIRINSDDALLGVDAIPHPGGGEEPLEFFEGSHKIEDNDMIEDFQLYPEFDKGNSNTENFRLNVESNGLCIDPRVLVAENQFLRCRLEQVQEKYLETARMHAEVELKLAAARKRIEVIEEDLSKDVPTGAIFQAEAEEAKQKLLVREREIRELKELLHAMNTTQGAATSKSAPNGSEKKVGSGAGLGLSEEGGENSSRD